MHDDYILIDRQKGTPPQADMCLTIDNDCMKPYIPQGEPVYVCRSEVPKEFEAGVFLYRGQVYCRQWCEDYSGSVHLLCANPEREGMNLTVSADDRENLICLGKVLLKKTLPPPIYGRGK